MSVFAELAPELTAVLASQGITEPTPVQSAVVPDAMAGYDVLGRARTGSGKTLAFGLPILSRWPASARARATPAPWSSSRPVSWPTRSLPRSSRWPLCGPQADHRLRRHAV